MNRWDDVMKYIKDNKKLLIKYLILLILNVVVTILCNYYFKDVRYKDIILLFVVVICDLVIYYFKGIVKYIWYLDIICNFIVGLVCMIFIKDMYNYTSVLLSLFLANNIIFMRSRYSDKIYKKFIQYIKIFIYTILCMFINVGIYLIIGV